MKYYTVKECNEISALMTLAESDKHELSSFATEALKGIATVGVEITIDEETIIDARIMDNNSDILDYITAYDECVAKSIDSTEDFTIKIEVLSLLTGEIIFCANYEVFNKGEATATSEWCSRKALREVI